MARRLERHTEVRRNDPVLQLPWHCMWVPDRLGNTHWIYGRREFVKPRPSPRCIMDHGDTGSCWVSVRWPYPVQRPTQNAFHRFAISILRSAHWRQPSFMPVLELEVVCPTGSRIIVVVVHFYAVYCYLHFYPAVFGTLTRILRSTFSGPHTPDSPSAVRALLLIQATRLGSAVDPCFIMSWSRYPGHGGGGFSPRA